MWLLLACFAWLLRLVSSYDIRIGTRPSQLAIVQARAVAQTLVDVNPIIVKIDVTSDCSSQDIRDVPLALQNVDFTGALDDAVFRGEVDIGVHSLKDLPPFHRWEHGESLQMTFPLPREDPSDVLVGPFENLRDIPPGSKIGTSSIRRQAQLLAVCGNDIQVVNIRGNVDARLKALQEGTVDALILAKSGLKRLGYMNDTVDVRDIPHNQMLPGVCQGIIAAVCRKDRDVFWKQDEDTSIAATCERAFLNELDKISPWHGRPPLAGLMKRQSDQSWCFDGLLAKPDGTQVLRASSSIHSFPSRREAADLGRLVASELIQHAGTNFFNVGQQETTPLQS